MKTRTIVGFTALLALLSTLNPQLSAGPLGTAFTYQGRLSSGTNAANGSFDLKFTLYDAQDGGSVVGTPQTNAAVNLVNGLYTVTLDFGSNAFPGTARPGAVRKLCWPGNLWPAHVDCKPEPGVKFC